LSYFVTGATGFIGRHLVQELLNNREGEIFALVREGSQERLAQLAEDWDGGERVTPVVGDLARERLGVEQSWIDEHRGDVEHFFHLAAVYDMTAEDEDNERANVTGTRNAVALANALEAGILHHASSVAVTGSYKGMFREDMFDEGQKLPSSYHQTKFDSEKIAREESTVPWRVYRPSVVIGHSKTGEMDKIDGPYYFFKALQKARHALPEWFPLVGLEFGYTNIVPVDYVAAAMDHIAHQPELDGQAFHLMASKSLLLQLPALKGVRRSILADLGIPEEILGHLGFTAQFDTRDSERALAGTGIEVPPLDSYAERIWDYWERVLDPDLYKDRSFEAAINGRTVVITGASSGIGRAAALKIAKAGGIPILVARSMDKLEEAKAEIESAGGTAYVYSADLSALDSIDELVKQILDDHVAVDMLVNNAGRSIRRSIALSQDRFHDFERTMQLNYFGAIRLTMGLLPHMRERGSGHIVNVSSIGAQTNPPRFSAYVASKAALDAWTRVVSSEVVGDGITFTTIHMPLVRTPMIAPTKMYDSFPTITPDEAGDLVCEALRAKPKQINTRLGTFGEVAYALAPKAVDQVLHMAYKVFPDSAAAKGEKDSNEKASMEQVAMANLMKGVHW
jgi:NAD(P)-dependent dehydrogenase (short-subunit alcohol dehydrogenase family)